MKNLKSNIILYFSIGIMALVGTINLNAQKAEFGLRFMPTFSSLNLTTSAGGKVKGEATLGYGFGALLGFNFSKHVGVQGEAIYSSSSQKYKELDLERNVKLQYLNIPLLLSLNTGKSSAVNLNIVAGPQVGISVGSSVHISGGNGTGEPLAVVSVKKGDIGFAYGAGLDFGLNQKRTVRLGLGYRGVFGLFDISDNNRSITTDSYYVLDRTHVKSHAGYIGLSILF